jgi:hypothetical protein
MASMNNIGDRGSPCWRPRPCFIGRLASLFRRILDEVVLHSSWTHVMLDLLWQLTGGKATSMMVGSDLYLQGGELGLWWWDEQEPVYWEVATLTWRIDCRACMRDQQRPKWWFGQGSRRHRTWARVRDSRRPRWRFGWGDKRWQVRRKPGVGTPMQLVGTRDGEQSWLTKASERETRDGAEAILDNDLPSLLEMTFERY